jgi:hypothetical protein
MAGTNFNTVLNATPVRREVARIEQPSTSAATMRIRVSRGRTFAIDILFNRITLRFKHIVKQNMSTAKMGRPEMAPEDRSAKITAVRLREDERQLVESAAKTKEQKLSDWMRETLISTAKRQLKGAA